MRTLLALDSFKGSLSSKEVEAAFSQALTDCLAPDGTIENVLHKALSGCRFILASDVRNPLYGLEGTVHVFGTTPEMVEELDRLPLEEAIRPEVARENIRRWVEKNFPLDQANISTE